jgi:hypothetical protein
LSGLIQQPGWLPQAKAPWSLAAKPSQNANFLTESAFLPFSSGSCSETEVSDQPWGFPKTSVLGRQALLVQQPSLFDQIIDLLYYIPI